MWRDDPREFIEAMFARLSGIFALAWQEGGYLFIDREERRRWEKKRRGVWMEALRCQQCGRYMEGALVRSGRKWCSNRCKQINKRKQETMRKNTKPDAPKALATTKKTLSSFDAVELAEKNVTAALQALSDALSGSPTIETVTVVEVAIKQWSKRLEDAEKISKALLVEHLKTHGDKTTEKGSLAANIHGYMVEARPWRTGYDSKKVEALLRAKELSVDELMDKEIRYIINESRLQMAVGSGALSEDELNTCRYELSYALQPIKKVGDK